MNCKRRESICQICWSSWFVVGVYNQKWNYAILKVARNEGRLIDMNDPKRKGKIDTDDGWNRTFYGSPTIGGLIVIGIIVIILFFK